MVGRNRGPQIDRRIIGAVAGIAALVLTIGALAASRSLSTAPAPPSGNGNPSSSAGPGPGRSDDPNPATGDFACAPQAITAGRAGRWRLVRAEYGPRDNFDYLRLNLRREGDHDQTAELQVQVVSRDDVSDSFGVDAAPDGDLALVVAFTNPVDISGSWARTPGYGALRGFRIQRGREGRVYVVAGVRGDGCYRLNGGSWTSSDAGAADVTLEISKR
jgi:hypothetical protein